MNSKTRKERFLVVGGCAAGMSAASKAKRMNPNLEVIAFEKTAHVSYSACGIPYYVSDLVREPEELIAVSAEEFRQRRGIEVLTLHEIVEVRPVQRVLVAVNLQTQQEAVYEYDRLMISVGGSPKKPLIPGMDLKNVFTVQTLQDGIDLRQFIDRRRPARAAIIGGGYIAMEMAEAFRLRFIEVTIVEREKQILPDFEEDIAQRVSQELQANAVRVLTSKRVESLEENSLGEVDALILKDENEAVPVDFVLVAAGLAPNVALGRKAGLRLGSTGAIAVDWKMQTSVPNICAAGDCVEVKNLVSGKPDYIPLGPTANKQGRVAGENIAGGYATFKGVVGTSVFKTFNLEVARTGLGSAAAKSLGYEVRCVTITENSKAGYYPGVNPVTVAVIFDKRSRRLLGAQMVGVAGVSKRIDIFAAALTNKMTLDEMASLDLSYAPPFAPVWDPVLVAVNVAKSRL
ncbi:MAG: FAD-dependent oxidoreductase [bacterium]